MMGMSSATFFTDPLNPHERKRHGKTPVGLKNLGNTCWFSVVVQVRMAMSESWWSACYANCCLLQS